MPAVSNPDTYRRNVPDLPADPGEFYAWQNHAACRGGRVAELFFAADYEAAASKARRETAAKKICNNACPVRQQCLDHALSFPERVGVWGGLTEDERNADARKAKRAQDKARWARRQAQQDSEVAA